MSIRDLRERTIADKAARQCRGDIGVYTDGSRLLVNVAVGGRHCTLLATASPRRYQMSPRTPRRMPPLLVGDRVNAKMMPTSRIPYSPAPRAIVRHRTPCPGEEEQVPTFSRRGRGQSQALRAIRVGSFRTTWNRRGEYLRTPENINEKGSVPSCVSSPLNITRGWVRYLRHPPI